MLSILFLGDVVGEPGRSAVIARLPELKEKWQLDFVDRERRERRGRSRDHPADHDRSSPRRRAGGDHRRSHLGPEGNRLVHRHRAAPAAAD